MNPQDRIHELQSIEAELLPLRQEATFLKAQFAFTKERYSKTYAESDKKQLVDLESKISPLDAKINPLALRAQSLRIKYLIEYEGQYQDYTGNLRTQVFSEYFHLVNDCQIDTFANGWYNLEPCMPLINEVCETIYQQRFSQGAIRQIKKV